MNPVVHHYTMPPPMMRILRVTCLIVALGCCWAAVAARAQDDTPTFSTWAKVEASTDAKDYGERLKKGEFDGKSKAFLEQIALPQLTLDGNRRTIERLRKRMREVLLNERVADAAALDQACTVAAAWLTAQARNKQLEPVVQVNAMLLVGELRGKDGRPWPAATEMLATATADPACPPAVRVAAAAGLARHLDSARAAGGVGASLAEKATQSLLTVISTPPAPADGAAGDWLVSRALDMLPSVLPKATPEAAAAITKILEDQGRAIDVRVRAAAALGAIAAAESNIDAARSVAAIRGIATAALKGDLLAAAERAMSRRMSGQAAPMMPGGFEGGPPGFPGAPFPGASGFGEGTGVAPVGDPIDLLVVGRDAWRLMTLANAVGTADGSRGLATLLAGPTAAPAIALAQALRDAATDLEQMPDAATMKQSLVSLEQVAVARPPAATPTKPATAPAATPPEAPAAESGEPAAADPFGGPAN
jgi:hypothetical protein